MGIDDIDLGKDFDFEQMLNESFENGKNNFVVDGIIVEISGDRVLVDVGQKVEGQIYISEITVNGEVMFKEGDSIPVMLMGSRGERPNISHKKVLQKLKFDAFVKLHGEDVENVTIEGKIISVKQRGGFIIEDEEGCEYFMPMAQSYLKAIGAVGKKVKAKVLQVNEAQSSIIVSRKKLIEEGKDKWGRITDKFEVGDPITVTVTNFESYGVFVDVGNDIQALLHISEISWNKNIKKPEELLTLGEEINVQVIELDVEKKRLRVSLKNLQEKPFVKFTKEHKVGEIITGKIATLTEFGAFITIGDIDGLLHNEEASWEFNTKCKSLFKIGEEVEVKIIKIDRAKEKVSLSIKEITNSPIKQSDYIKNDKENLSKKNISTILNWADDNGISQNLISKDETELLNTKNLDFFGKIFESLPEGLEILNKLETLILWDVGISYLPKNIVKLKNLKKLNLRGNPNLSITISQKEWLDNLKDTGTQLFIERVNIIDEKEYKHLSENRILFDYEKLSEVIEEWILDKFKEQYNVVLYNNEKSKIRIKSEAKKVAKDLLNKETSKINLLYLSQSKHFIKDLVTLDTFGIPLNKTIKKENKLFDFMNEEVEETKDFKLLVQPIERDSKEILEDLKNNGIELNKASIDSALLSIGEPVHEDDLIVLFSQEETILNIVLLKRIKADYKVVDSIKNNIGYEDIIHSIKEWIYDELEDLYGLNMNKEEHNLLTNNEVDLNELIIIKSINAYISELNINKSNEVKLSEIILSEDSKVDIILDFTREQFVDETIGFRKKSLDTIKKLLSNNQLIAKDIKHIIQSGRTSRIESLQNSIKFTFGVNIYVSTDDLLKDCVCVIEEEHIFLEYSLTNINQPIPKLINSKLDLENIKKIIFIEYNKMIDRYYDLFDNVEDQLDEKTIKSLEIIGKLLENRQKRMESLFKRFMPDDSWNIIKIQNKFNSLLVDFLKDILEATSESIANGLKENTVYEDIFKIIGDFYRYVGVNIYNDTTSQEIQINIDSMFKDKNLLNIVKKLVGKELITQNDLDNIKTLDCKGKDIEFLDGIENLHNLKKLKAGANPKLNDIDCIKNLTLLESVKLGDTSLKSIESLLKLNNLIDLSIFNYTDNNLQDTIITLVNNNKKLTSLKINYRDYHKVNILKYRA